METLLQDGRFGIRQLRRAPGTALAIVLSLAVAIGANTTIFTLLKAVFMEPVPVTEPHRVFHLYRTFEQAAAGSGGLLPTAYLNFEDLRDRGQGIGRLAAYTFGAFNLASGGEPEQVFGQYVNGDYFSLLGIEPATGRFFLPEEDRTRGSHPVAVLSHGLWQRRFAADPALVGRDIVLNARTFTVVGVAPRGFSGLDTLFAPQLWVPMSMYPALNQGLAAEALDRRDLRFFSVFGRLAPGVSLERAEAELAVVAKQLAEEHPLVNANRGVRLFSLPESALGPQQRGLFVRAGAMLAVAVGLVLLIACANAANLLLARARRRQGEIALRLHLGAPRRRLVRQLLTESLLLALAGGALGWLFAIWGREVLWSLRPPILEQVVLDLSLDARVLAFCLGATLVTGVLFGLAPALAAGRTDLAGALPGRGLASTGGRRLLRQGLVVAQVALSLVALIGAGLFLESLANARRIDPGYETGHLAVLSVDPAAQGLGPEQIRGFAEELERRVAALPGVEAVGLSSSAPLSFSIAWRIKVPGAEEASGPDGTYVNLATVTPGYRRALGLRLREGRWFTGEDRAGGRPVVVVNRTMAERFWPGGGAVGGAVTWPAAEEPFTVVGVVEDIKYSTLGEDPAPYFYRPVAQGELAAATLHVRTAGPSGPQLETVRREIRALDPLMPVFGTRVVGDLIEEGLWAPRLAVQLLGAFALAALALAATGLYAVLAYSVQRRRHEIGVRMALGARRREVLGLVLREGMAQVMVGALCGVLLAVAGGRLLAALLYGMSGVEPGVLAAAVALLGAIALAACLLPALRATRVEAATVLREG